MKTKATTNMMKKSDYELLFHDSPDYFLVKNAKMVQESGLVHFICFDENNVWSHEEFYPYSNIQRMKRY